MIRVNELPPASTKPHLFGESVTLAEAERVVGFRPLLPSDLDPPTAYASIASARTSSSCSMAGRMVRLRLTEPNGGVIEKQAQIDQRVERVEVDGHAGIWLEGRHVVTEPFGMPRLSGNILALGAGRSDIAPRGTVHQGAGAWARPHGSLSSVRK